MKGYDDYPALRGGLMALLAAALFGVSTPLVQRLGHGLGPFTTAALLYAGAALAGAVLRRPIEREARVRRADLPRLLLMAALGAVLGPVALAWGLQHASGTAASLMLSLEAVFTALLASSLYGEAMDWRTRLAMAALTAGGMVLALGGGAASGGAEHWGLLAVLAATAAWGLDNTLSRALAERDPGEVVLLKAALGAAASAGLGALAGEPLPGWLLALGLLAVGFAGYGLSLRCYLLAQRAFGAGRTGSVFAFAPFIGASLAWVMGAEPVHASLLVGGGLMLLGVVLHLAEAHDHAHAHETMVHEHAHSHDDEHHAHGHDPVPEGEHSHEHEHRPLRHSHAHAPDAHHLHRH